MLHRVLVQRYCIALAFLIGIRVVTCEDCIQVRSCGDDGELSLLEFDDAEAFKPKIYLYDLDVI